ncbi:O-antigen ligase family protein [Sphingosinicella terrae]|uniref:O-antigen ligase family protein n=1 Tax=Sphingosinicella terrae TaxID=2172047 RepID=UPI0013B40D08|nr:O-antigen ligase family protein [Sphingosinicella terrae]
MRDRVLSAVLAFYVFLCLLLGGASAAGLWANLLLQLLAVPLLCLSIAVRTGAGLSPPARSLILLLILGGGLVAVQLIPLPPAIWTALPGREPVQQAFLLLDRPLPWLPLSLAPYSTAASALWLLPASAVLLAMLRFQVRESWIGWSIVLAMGLSVLVGALQISGGPESSWYFYEITNYGVTVGFFSNANHMATLLVVAVPFIGALLMSALPKGGRSSRSSALLLVGGGLLLLVVIGIVINGSLAGIGLMIPAVGATALLAMRRRKVPAWAVGAIALLAVASVTAVFSGRFDNNLISEEAQGDVVSRYTTFTTSFEAAKDHFPFGSGIGTFPQIYRMYEDPDRVTTTYINHVHSDWIEVLLETGLFGGILLILFLLWWTRRATAIWRAAEPDYFGRAATIASAVIMAHSLVDYPLRTVAISAIFAACCAMMSRVRIRADQGGKRWPPKRPTLHLTAD